MHALMIVLALSAAGLMGWRLIKERRRATRRRAIRQRQDDEASQNWKAAQDRARRDAPAGGRR
jgi:Flp pilus assembly protein TadB